MASASMTVAVASTSFAAVAARAESTLSRNGGALSMAAPMSGALAMSCVFSDISLSKRSGSNAAIVARAAEVPEYTFGETETATETEAASAAAAPVQQGSKKLYVGNLPWSCDSAQLADICQDIGTVEEVEVIYDQGSVAFVTMASTEDAQAVINAWTGLIWEDGL